MAINGVLFDLDGTLLDTALDLGAAANVALRQYGYAEISDEQAYQYSSHGAQGLLHAALGERYEQIDTAPLRQALLDAYRQNLCQRTQVYAGITELLAYLKQAQIPWGIVTNKHAWLTDPLLEQVPALADSKINISGDTFEVAKPHPKPLLEAAKVLQVHPAEILYVGDAQRDMEAARDAQMQGCVALWGYLRPEDQPLTWPASWACESPMQLLEKLTA